MLFVHSVARTSDNSGARRMKILTVYGGSSRKYAVLGDMVKSVPRSLIKVPQYQIRHSKYKKVKKKGKYFSLIISVKRKTFRGDGTSVRRS